MEKHLNSQNTAVDIKCVIHHVSQDRILPRLTTQWCWFVDWEIIILIQTNLQNGNTASTSRPFGHNVSQVALRYDECRSLQCSWNPYLCHHWRLTLPFAISHTKSLPNHPSKALQHLEACFAGLHAVHAGGVGNVYGTSKSLCHPVSNFGKWML